MFGNIRIGYEFWMFGEWHVVLARSQAELPCETWASLHQWVSNMALDAEYAVNGINWWSTPYRVFVREA